MRYFAQTDDERVVVWGRNRPIYVTWLACPMGRKKDMVNTYGEGALGISKTRTIASLSVGRSEAVGKPLVGIWYGRFVKVAAYNGCVIGIALDEGTDAVGLCASIGRGEAVGKPLVGVWYGCFVKVAAYNGRVVGITLDEGADAVGLCSSVCRRFA